MAHYLLSVHLVEGEPVPLPEQMAQAYMDVDVFNQELRAAGAWVFAGGLQPATAAAVVRISDGDVLTTDGPFAETKEWLSGFWIVSAPELDAALDLAARGSRACGRPVEVRPFQEELEG
jgi:hypothetical protein